MKYADPRLHQGRTARVAEAERRNAGASDVVFHVAGCDCRHCADPTEPRLEVVDVVGIGVVGFLLGFSLALMLAFAGHPTATTLAVLAAVGINL